MRARALEPPRSAPTLIFSPRLSPRLGPGPRPRPPKPSPHQARPLPLPRGAIALLHWLCAHVGCTRTGASRDAYTRTCTRTCTCTCSMQRLCVHAHCRLHCASLPIHIVAMHSAHTACSARHAHRAPGAHQLLRHAGVARARALQLLRQGGLRGRGAPPCAGRQAAALARALGSLRAWLSVGLATGSTGAPLSSLVPLGAHGVRGGVCAVVPLASLAAPSHRAGLLDSAPHRTDRRPGVLRRAFDRAQAWRPPPPHGLLASRLWVAHGY